MWFRAIGWFITGVVGLAASDLRVLDERLKLTEFVPSPQIRTPIGIAIDRDDRIFVVESHTHHPPKNYQGPKGDIIKVYRDVDYDGKPDTVRDFARDIHQAMNLAFSPEGELFVVCARSVWALHDRDGDGQSERRTRVLRVETENKYAHSCQMGITFDADGRMYISRGNNGGRAYGVIGSDGSRISGFGDGGSIYRCRPDGGGLEEFATGFWNPFEVRFDSYGRLLALDNDPDARGPNRLVHVVEGGDYGYRSIHGGGGNHPYQGWNGDLPGTLPYVVGVGEAPCGLLDCNRSGLPADFTDDYLAAIWNENSVVRIVPRAAGQSIRAAVKPLITGGKDFRPVAMASDSQGNVFITDWVKVTYPNHGHGRILRLSSRQPIRRLQSPLVGRGLSPDLEAEDPFARHAGMMQLGEKQARGLLRDRKPHRRLAAALALRRLEVRDAESIVSSLLSDPDEEIRRLALIWIGEAGMLPLKSGLKLVLEHPNLSSRLFATYLATHEVLDPAFVAGRRARTGSSKQIRRGDATPVLLEILNTQTLSSSLRAKAVTRLGGGHRELLRRLATGTERKVRKEAIRSLSGDGTNGDLFERIAGDRKNDPDVRAEAVAALARLPSPPRALLMRLAKDPEYLVAKEAERALRLFFGHVEKRRPETIDEWEARLADGGDPVAGERVFHSQRTQCSTCHQHHHRGRRIGPDLSNVGESLDRKQIIRAIVRPSESYPPQYQAWFVELKDELSYSGLQLDHLSGGDISLFTTEGITRRFKAADIADYGVFEKSLMPDGLEAIMTVEEMRDLVAFLSGDRRME